MLVHFCVLSQDFVALPIIFYLVVLAGGLKIDELRKNGWVFDVGEERDPWYKFYTMFGMLISRIVSKLTQFVSEFRLFLYGIRFPPDKLDGDMGDDAYPGCAVVFQRPPSSLERSCARLVKITSRRVGS